LVSGDLASAGNNSLTVTNGSNYCTSNTVSFTVSPTSGGGGSGWWNYPHYAYITTNIPENISKNSVILKGSINPNGSSATAWFEYGISSGFQTPSVTTQLSVGSATYFLPFSQTIMNLSPNTTYYSRAVGRNYAGTVNGNIYSFVTPKDNIAGGGTDINPVINPPNPGATDTKSNPFAGVSDLVNQQKTNISSSIIKWLGIFVLVLIVAIIISKLRGRSKHKNN
jgi:hypothetical protein